LVRFWCGFGAVFMPVVRDQRDAQYQMRAIELVPTRATRVSAKYRHFCCRGYVFLVRHRHPENAATRRAAPLRPNEVQTFLYSREQLSK